MRELHLFAGSGGGILGGVLLGHTCVCAVEIEQYPRAVLLQRQRDGILPRFPVWDDITTFDGIPWRGRVDVVCGGFPCQDISCAGKAVGLREGKRSGLWSEMARVVGEVQPKLVFVENSPALTYGGLDIVLGDLSCLGYDAVWGVLGAAHAGAPHKRDRIWILAYAEEQGLERPKSAGNPCAGGCTPERSNACGASSAALCDSASKGLEKWAEKSLGRFGVQTQPERSDWWATEPDVGRMADGVASRVDRIKSIGNGQVPAVAALAWTTLMSRVTP